MLWRGQRGLKHSINLTNNNVTRLNTMANQYTNKEKPGITEEQFQAVIAQICDGIGIYNACKTVGISTRSYYEYINSDVNAKKYHADAKTCRTDYLLNEIERQNELCHSELQVCDPQRCGAIQRYYDSKIKGLFELVKKLNSNEYGDKIQHDVEATMRITRDITLPAKKADGE